MDPDRWPDIIRTAVESVHCPRCGTAKADGVMVTVRFNAPVWTIIANCFRCNNVHGWNLVDPTGAAMPKPVTAAGATPTASFNEDAGAQPVPAPEWLKAL